MEQLQVEKEDLSREKEATEAESRGELELLRVTFEGVRKTTETIKRCQGVLVEHRPTV